MGVLEGNSSKEVQYGLLYSHRYLGTKDMLVACKYGTHVLF